MHLECIWMHWLNGAAGLVTEVQRALIGPLWLTRDTTRETESFPIGVNNLEATETSVGHKIFSCGHSEIPNKDFVHFERLFHL
jgi:hypothetical protein